MRRIALTLPGVVEIPSDGFDFRVDDKGFVWSYPEGFGRGRRIRTDIAVLFVGDEATRPSLRGRESTQKQALLLGEPDLFFTTPADADHALALLRLDHVDAGRLRELITDAWDMRRSPR